MGIYGKCSDKKVKESATIALQKDRRTDRKTDRQEDR